MRPRTSLISECLIVLSICSSWGPYFKNDWTNCSGIKQQAAVRERLNEPENRREGKEMTRTQWTRRWGLRHPNDSLDFARSLIALTDERTCELRRAHSSSSNRPSLERGCLHLWWAPVGDDDVQEWNQRSLDKWWWWRNGRRRWGRRTVRRGNSR